ncbi:centrosome and spindle pole-associated protein 1-like isoform 4-T4 [Menidia menidia]
MDDELESFIRERKVRVAKDKASLEQDPPYMEMKSKPRRAHGTTAKENIPPQFMTQGKDEGCIVGLPLGVEYEKKKQRLQQELRMDYRRYMAQKKHFDPGEPEALTLYASRKAIKLLPEEQAGVFPKHRSPLQRDMAAVMENRGLRLARVGSPSVEEDEGPSSVLPRHCDQQAKPGDQDSEEVAAECFRAEPEPTDGRRRRTLGAGTNFDRSQTTRNNERDKREMLVGTGREVRRSTALYKNNSAEFITGLLIGAADTDEALQRRKELYRQELQEQIAEQHRNKKREKDLELKVAATGANDPEKQPDRIKQFGLSRRKGPSATGESNESTGNERSSIREREMPPPDQPHVAFQSPLLEYSSALGLSPNIQPPAPSFPSPMDIPSEAYRSPCGECHPYYGTRNPIDPNMAYYGHLSVPGAGFPLSYWGMPPAGAVPSQFGHRSPHGQHSVCSFPERPVHRPGSETTGVDSKGVGFPLEQPRSTRDRILSYREALKQQEASRRGSGHQYNQIQEQQERRLFEQEERERYEARLEADMKNHQPWGRGGGGAPLRDSTGNLIADLNQMHKLNEEAYSNPEQWQRRATAAMKARRAGIAAETCNHNSTDRISSFTHVKSPQFARGNVFANQPTEQQLQEQDKYKAYLKHQIEEKMRKKAEERERTRLEEEKEERRLAEQRARIQREYEEEQERKRRKEMEQKAKNEELIQLAEQRKKEAERKKKEVEEKESAALRRQYEGERQARVEEVRREPSPPIPTLQKKQGSQQYTPRPPTIDSQRSALPLSEHSLSGLQSPPVPACRNQLRAAGEQRDLFSELSSLRHQLRSEQKRLESRLQQGDWEELDSPISLRHRERPPVDVFDMARLRLQAPVRRPSSRNTEPRNLLRIHDLLQLKHADAEWRLGSGDSNAASGGASRRSRDCRDSCQQFVSWRSTVQDDYGDLSPPQRNDYLRSASGGSGGSFLLESESAFIDPLGDDSPLLHAPELERICQLSARERRRLAKQERSTISHPIGHHDGYTAHSGDRLRHNVEPTKPVDTSDEDSSHFSPPSLNNRSSVETTTMEPWMRPGTSVKCLDRPLRRNQVTTGVQ